MSYFKDYLYQFKDKNIIIYIDMDGVVADYDVLSFNEDKYKEDLYLNKRPVKTIIDILEDVSTLNNTSLNILSCTKKENQINGKYIWLSKHMSFIKKENINIIARESKNYEKSCIIKAEFLKNNYDNNSVIIIIDDSHDVLKEIIKLDLGIIPLHISSIIE